jgi:hypothetical protein
MFSAVKVVPPDAHATLVALWFVASAGQDRRRARVVQPVVAALAALVLEALRPSGGRVTYTTCPTRNTGVAAQEHGPWDRFRCV